MDSLALNSEHFAMIVDSLDPDSEEDFGMSISDPELLYKVWLDVFWAIFRFRVENMEKISVYT